MIRNKSGSMVIKKPNMDESVRSSENDSYADPKAQIPGEDWIREHIEKYGVEPNLFNGA